MFKCISFVFLCKAHVIQPGLSKKVFYQLVRSSFYFRFHFFFVELANNTHEVDSIYILSGIFL